MVEEIVNINTPDVTVKEHSKKDKKAEYNRNYYNKSKKFKKSKSESNNKKSDETLDNIKTESVIDDKKLEKTTEINDSVSEDEKIYKNIDIKIEQKTKTKPVYKNPAFIAGTIVGFLGITYLIMRILSFRKHTNFQHETDDYVIDNYNNYLGEGFET